MGMQQALPGVEPEKLRATSRNPVLLKYCCQCGNWLALDAFSLRMTGTNKRAAYCKPCTRAYCRQHYRINKPLHLRRRYGRTISERVENRRAVLQYLENHPCVDCGEANPIVLEFDHVRGVKAGDISSMVYKQTKARVLEEIKKCEVRCANCHRVKTFKERWQGSAMRRRVAGGSSGW